MPRCFLSSVRPRSCGLIYEPGEFSYEPDFKPTWIRGPKQNLKRQKILLKNNETIYNDKVPISTRFYLQLLKRSQFLPHFIETEIYDFALETEKGAKSPEPPKNRNKKLIDKTYNLRSNEAKTQRKTYDKFGTQRKVKNGNANENQELDKKQKAKEPLAPIIEEIKTREPLKAKSKGSEIDKIAEKLKSLVRTSVAGRLDDELKSCKESFEEMLEPKVEDADNTEVPIPLNRSRTRGLHCCNHCGKGFDRPWVLKGHMRLHTGERPFPCPVPHCGRTFADRSNLRAHQRTRGHHTWPWRCAECGKAFSQRCYLQRHRESACRKYKMVSRNSKLDASSAKDAPLPVPLYGIICHNSTKNNVNADESRMTENTTVISENINNEQNCTLTQYKEGPSNETPLRDTDVQNSLDFNHSFESEESCMENNIKVLKDLYQDVALIGGHSEAPIDLSMAKRNIFV